LESKAPGDVAPLAGVPAPGGLGGGQEGAEGVAVYPVGEDHQPVVEALAGVVVRLDVGGDARHRGRGGGAILGRLGGWLAAPWRGGAVAAGVVVPKGAAVAVNGASQHPP